MIPRDYKMSKIERETVLGENEEFDKTFFSYLNEYSIDHKILESEGTIGYPIVEYIGGPISLRNMLKDKFGMSDEEITGIHPEIANENFK
jgi:hypothetical protein